MNYAEEEKTIDLKQLLYFILKHWKTIFIFLVVGILLGCGLSILMGQKSLDDINVDKLNMDNIMQYHRVMELYDLRLQNEEKSIVLQLDPNNVFSSTKTYYISAAPSEMQYIAEQYSTILLDDATLKELVTVSGYDCELAEIRDLVVVNFSGLPASTVFSDYGLAPRNGTLTLSAVATSAEIADALLNVLDTYVQKYNELFVSRNSMFACELLNQRTYTGYNDAVFELQERSNNVLKNYVEDIVLLRENFTPDEEFYYTYTYEPEKLNSSILVQTIKLAILFGALLCIVACAYYCIRFLLDNRIKTTEEAANYGVYPIATLNADAQKKFDIVDRIFGSDKLPTNSREYLLNAVQALCNGKTILSGDKQDEQILDVMEWLASQTDNATVTDTLAKDENGMTLAKESENAILFVRLWKTNSSDFKRELMVLNQIDRTATGIVILR